MNSKNIKMIEEITESLGWGFKEYKEDNYLRFEIDSPESQDFSVEISTEDVTEILLINKILIELKREYDNFDVSERTYVWLDETGHGQNGACYDMKDLYEDMEYCKDAILELIDEIYKAVNK